MQLTIRPGTVQLYLTPEELDRLTKDSHVELPLGSGEDRIIIGVDVRAGAAPRRPGSTPSAEQMSVENEPATDR